jgi:hypothetical protein
MDTLDWITLAIFFALGFWVGNKLTAWLHREVLRDLLNELGVTQEDLIKIQSKMAKRLAEEASDTPVNSSDSTDREVAYITIEKHNDTLYAFRKDTDQFIGQGATAEELIKRIGEKARNIRFIVTPEDGSELIGANTKWEYKTDKKELSRLDKTEE